MNAIFKREELAKALTVAAGVAPLQSARPGLRDALLTIQPGPAGSGGACEVQAIDMEVGVRYSFQAESVATDGGVFAICLPAGLVSGLLKECTDDTVTLDVAPTKTAGTIYVGRDVFEIACRPADDFPEVPGADDADSFTLPASMLAKALELTLFAAAREQGRYAINGVHLRGIECGQSDTRLDVVTTDGRRLALARLSVPYLPVPFMDAGQSIILPIKAAQEVHRICKAAGKDVVARLSFHNRTLIVSVAHVTLSGLLVSGLYPKYENIIPKGVDKVVTFNREAMLRALSKAAYLESDDTNAVMFEFTPGACQIKCADADKGSAEVHLPVEYAGADTIQFNSRYLAEVLKVLDAATVTLSIADHTRPGVIKSGTDYTYVIMPINKE
jgi:DNA polymerase III subunit beta